MYINLEESIVDYLLIQINPGGSKTNFFMEEIYTVYYLHTRNFLVINLSCNEHHSSDNILTICGNLIQENKLISWHNKDILN